jgi:hypothetical protein
MPLASALFAKFTRPVVVAELHRLSGSTASLKKFRQNLCAALDVLRRKGVATAWIDRETDTVRHAPLGSLISDASLEPTHQGAPVQRELPLLVKAVPTVSRTGEGKNSAPSTARAQHTTWKWRSRSRSRSHSTESVASE